MLEKSEAGTGPVLELGKEGASEGRKKNDYKQARTRYTKYQAFSSQDPKHQEER